MDKRGWYDYNHATAGQQFLAILIVITVIGACGLALALFGFGLLT